VNNENPRRCVRALASGDAHALRVGLEAAARCPPEANPEMPDHIIDAVMVGSIHIDGAVAWVRSGRDICH
jgi:hypothetical protein